MIITFTQEEAQELRELESSFEQKLSEKEREIDRLRDPNDIPQEDDSIFVPTPPEMPKKKTKKALEAYHKALKEWNQLNDAQNERVNQIFDQWYEAGSDEWKKAREEYFKLQDAHVKARRRFYDKCERRHFAQLGGDREKILDNARDQADRLINSEYDQYKRKADTGLDEEGKRLRSFSGRSLRVDGRDIYLDAQTMIEQIRENLRLHFQFFEPDHEATEELESIIFDVVSRSPFVSGDKGILGAYYEIETTDLLPAIKANRPVNFITPIDKVTSVAFDGELISGEAVGVEVIKERKSRKAIRTGLMIDFSELDAVTIKGRRELTAFDREVHDAIITLMIEGENQFITVNMIYQTMTGKTEAHCSQKQAEAISESVTKLMFSHVKIDARPEAEVDKRLTRATYDSNMINAKRITVSINGQTVEAIQILSTPILYDYASQKNQIGRFDIKLLDTPNNKNEETIILEGYLRRRILSIKNNANISPTILYDTIYDKLDLSASSEGALRKKKLKIRESVKKTLDYFKKEGFIKGYVENSHKAEKNRIVSVTVRY